LEGVVRIATEIKSDIVGLLMQKQWQIPHWLILLKKMIE
jgi:hypothetical protein